MGTDFSEEPASSNLRSRKGTNVWKEQLLPEVGVFLPDCTSVVLSSYLKALCLFFPKYCKSSVCVCVCMYIYVRVCVCVCVCAVYVPCSVIRAATRHDWTLRPPYPRHAQNQVWWSPEPIWTLWCIGSRFLGHSTGSPVTTATGGKYLARRGLKCGC